MSTDPYGHDWDEGRSYGGACGWSLSVLYFCKMCGVGREVDRFYGRVTKPEVCGPYTVWDGVSKCEGERS